MNNQNVFSNPFLNNKGTDLTDIYNKINTLKMQQQQTQPPIQNAYDDLRDLYKDMSIDERKYIESSNEFISANIQYQEAFSNFLIDKFGGEFLQSKYGVTVEKVVATIKDKKEKYRENLTNDISTIKEQNKELITKNEELAKNNQELTNLIKSLQDQLWVKK